MQFIHQNDCLLVFGYVMEKSPMGKRGDVAAGLNTDASE